MNNKTQAIPLSEAAKAANISTRKRAFKFWLISHLLMTKEARIYIYMLHMYLRWADDFIDTTSNSAEDKIKFVRYLFTLKEKILNHHYDFNKLEEHYLYYSIKFAEGKNRPLILNCIDQYHELFEMEANRLSRGGIYSKEEFERYVFVNITSLMPVFHLFLYYNSATNIDYGVIGRFFLYVRLLKDFEEDVNVGYLNICKEDIEKYNLNTTNILNDPKRFLWAESFSTEIFKALFDELEVMAKAPLKVKLFWTLGYIYLAKEILQIKCYKFQFGCKIKKNIVTEIIILSSTIRLGSKIIQKIFF
ncbi:MAG: hypothetical protein HXY50_13385 [Ignavibacteriaceae bacterium]|nr:hypothetical protein [Ignavibacteriaceae bacterium]